MAVTATPIFTQTVKNWAVQILPADTTTFKTLVTGGTNGSIVEMINAYSTDTTLREVQLALSDGTTTFPMITVTVAVNAGNTSTVAGAPPNLLSGGAPFLLPGNWSAPPIDYTGSKYIYVANGWTLKVRAVTTVTAAKELDIVCQGGDF